MTNKIINYNDELKNFGYTHELSRTLTTSQLTFFGLTYLQPVGPAVVFGYLLTMTQGTVALPYLFAFIGMIFTVLSYSILIKEYPLAGSIYSYVKYIAGPFYGFIAGWLLMLDYLLIPSITSATAALFANKLLPGISYEIWLFVIVVSTGTLNITGIKPTVLFNSFLLLIQLIIVLAGLIIWSIYIVNNSNGISGLFSLEPFHYETITGVIGASSLAIFSFLGFDAVTTLAEESVDPRKDIPRAMFICILIGFLIMFITGYLGVLAIPDWQKLTLDGSWINATLFNINQLCGGNLFTIMYTAGFILAMAVTNLVGTTAASRLLYSMGRDKKISKSIFAKVSMRSKTPYLNIIFIMIVELVIGSCMSQNQIANLINYGAISGFIILNLSLIFLGNQLNKKLAKSKVENKIFINHAKFALSYFFFPLAGFLIMFLILINMELSTLFFGTLWLIIGVLYYQFNKKYSQI